jgi:hypothetical protein
MRCRVLAVLAVLAALAVLHPTNATRRTGIKRPLEEEHEEEVIGRNDPEEDSGVEPKGHTRTRDRPPPDVSLVTGVRLAQLEQRLAPVHQSLRQPQLYIDQAAQQHAQQHAQQQAQQQGQQQPQQAPQARQAQQHASVGGDTEMLVYFITLSPSGEGHPMREASLELAAHLFATWGTTGTAVMESSSAGVRHIHAVVVVEAQRWRPSRARNAPRDRIAAEIPGYRSAKLMVLAAWRCCSIVAQLLLAGSLTL